MPLFLPVSEALNDDSSSSWHHRKIQHEILMTRKAEKFCSQNKMPMFQVSKSFALIFCSLKTDISSIVTFFFSFTLIPWVILFTAHPDFLGQEEGETYDVWREKIPVKKSR